MSICTLVFKRSLTKLLSNWALLSVANLRHIEIQALFFLYYHALGNIMSSKLLVDAFFIV